MQDTELAATLLEIINQHSLNDERLRSRLFKLFSRVNIDRSALKITRGEVALAQPVSIFGCTCGRSTTTGLYSVRRAGEPVDLVDLACSIVDALLVFKTSSQETLGLLASVYDLFNPREAGGRREEKYWMWDVDLSTRVATPSLSDGEHYRSDALGWSDFGGKYGRSLFGSTTKCSADYMDKFRHNKKTLTSFVLGASDIVEVYK